MKHVPSAFKRWWNILFEAAGGVPAPAGGGVTANTINGLPTANSFHAGDRLLVLKGTAYRTIRGTCAGVSSDPNATVINGFSVSLDADLNAADFAAAIVEALNTPTNLAEIKATDIVDNEDGTFDIDFYPGIAANSYTATGTDNNPSFTELNPGTSELEQVDKATVSGTPGTGIVLLSSTTVNLNEGTAAKQSLYTCPANKRVIVTQLIYQNFSATLNHAVASVGWNAGATGLGTLDSSIVGPTAADLVNTVGSPDLWAFSYPEGTAGDILGLKVVTPEGTALTAIIDVFGYLTDTSGVPQANILT